MRRRCVTRLAMFSGVLLTAAGTAIGQQPPERVVVTGSRLSSLSLGGPSPVTVLTAEDLPLDGLAKVEDLLGALPFVFDAQDSSVSNKATGTAQVDLRGLGAQRNLVLVNGRRMNLGSPMAGGLAADLNQIPAGLVERVEVLTGGASAVYGPDAVAGVVNFVLKDRFEGLQLTYRHSFYSHSQGNPVAGLVAEAAIANPSQYVVPGDVASDGDIHNVSVLVGGNFAGERGNATLYFDWKKEDAILQSSRDFSACALDSFVTLACGGSFNGYPGFFVLNQGPVTLDRDSGALRSFSRARDRFNYGPYNYYRRPSEKYTFGAFAHYQLLSDVKAYAELLYHSDRTVAQIAPGGLFNYYASGPSAIRATNPLLTPQWIQALTTSNAANLDLATGLPAPLPFDANNPASIVIGRRNVEGGPRQEDLAHTSYRAVFGIEGRAFDHWRYDVSLQTGRVELARRYLNDFSRTRIGRALNVVTDANGNAVCQSVVDGSDPSCAPYNPWVLGGINAATLQYLQVPAIANGSAERRIVSAHWTTDLGAYGLRLPGARNGIGIALGAERRIDRLEVVPDVLFSTADLAGFTSATVATNGSIRVGEYFGELNVPLIEKHPMADLLQLSGSYRYSKYSTGKTSDTYGAGIEWAPVSAYRLRASYQRAVRAADLYESFSPRSSSLFLLRAGDPCGTAKRATLEQCQRSGITAVNYGSVTLDASLATYNGFGGGNSNLEPETADTVTMGLVFQPNRRLSGAIDYWQIRVDDAIEQFPDAAVILEQCVFDGRLCDLVHRDRFGTLWLLPEGAVDARAANLGSTAARGWDFAASYTHSLGGHGTLDIHFLGTRMTRRELEFVKGGARVDCVGLWSGRCGAPTPKWRHRFRAIWKTPWNIDLALTWRHIDAVRNEELLDPDLAALFPIDKKMDARDYLDIAGRWRIDKRFTLTAGVNNITDRDPPVNGSGANGNTYPGFYDTLGRLVFISLQANF